VDDYKISKNNTEVDIPDRSHDTNVPLYNCSGLYSTNPFCTKEYVPDNNIDVKLTEKINYSDCENIQIHEDINQQKKIYNDICRKKFGTEYIFDDNIYDTSTIIKCNDKDNHKQIKCKVDFSDEYIEHFNNIQSYAPYVNVNMNICISVLLIILILILITLFHI